MYKQKQKLWLLIYQSLQRNYILWRKQTFTESIRIITQGKPKDLAFSIVSFSNICHRSTFVEYTSIEIHVHIHRPIHTPVQYLPGHKTSHVTVMLKKKSLFHKSCHILGKIKIS